MRWTADKIGFLVAYPNKRQAGAASLGMRVIECIASDTPRFIADRLYVPDAPGSKRFQSESFQVPPSTFNIIGFSCSFELDYFNVLLMLTNAGIPPLAKDRDVARATGKHVPVIIAGGIAVSANPLPLLPYLDFIIIHDAEVTLPRFLGEFTRFVDGGGSLRDWWGSYTRERGCIIPSFLHAHGAGLPELLHIDFARCTRASLDAFPVPSPVAFPDPEADTREPAALGDTYLLETGRGCGTGCRFCMVSYHLRPYRFRSLGKIAGLLDALRNQGGMPGKISLLGSNVADHPDLASICTGILARGFSCSLPSIKVASDAGLLGVIKSANMKTITIAPETGSDRLRRVINKPVSNVEYETLVSRLVEHGVSKIKVYLLLGLPFEQDTDLQATLEFLGRIKAITARAGARVDVSLNPFVPKMGTPFMFHVANYKNDCFHAFKKKYTAFARAIEKVTRGTVSRMSLKEARLQAVLSLGGVELAPYLVPGSMEPRTPPVDAFPLGVIDAVFSRTEALLADGMESHVIQSIIPVHLSFLRKEWARASECKYTPPCSDHACAGCGIVDCPFVGPEKGDYKE